MPLFVVEPELTKTRGSSAKNVFVGAPVKVAVTFIAAFIVSTQVDALPEHAPPQVVKVWPEVGVSVRVTTVPET